MSNVSPSVPESNLPAPAASRHLPRVFWLAAAHFGIFIGGCIITVLAITQIPLELLFFYPCFTFLISAILFLWALVGMFRTSLRRRKIAFGLSAAMSIVVPISLLSFAHPFCFNWGYRIEAARTAPLTDFQAWEIQLLNQPDPTPKDLFFSGSDPRVPANLRRFTRGFRVKVERPAPTDTAYKDPHVELIQGGGFLELHWGIMIGPPSYVPTRTDLHLRKWADGIYFFYG